MSDVDDLLADLRAAAHAITGDVAKVIERGALNVKTDWRQRWSDIGHAPRLDEAITYDVAAGGLSAEIGPDKERTQGALGNIIEFGTVNNAPIPGGQPALDAEAPRLADAIAAAAARRLTR